MPKIKNYKINASQKYLYMKKSKTGLGGRRR